MRPSVRLLLMLLACVAALATLVLFVVWPAIDAQLMRIPMTDGIAALRRGDQAGVEAQCLPKAVVFIGDTEMDASAFIARLVPLVTAYGDRRTGSFRFTGYHNLRRRADTVETEFTIAIQIDAGEENPYRMAPTLERGGEVTLVRQGLFRWRIARIGTRDTELEALALREGVLSLTEGL